MKARVCLYLAMSIGVGISLAGCAPRREFRLKDVDGKDVSLADYRGKTVLLSFWAVG